MRCFYQWAVNANIFDEWSIRMVMSLTYWYKAAEIKEQLCVEKAFHKNTKRVGIRWRMLKKGQKKSSLPAWEQFSALAATG